MVDQVKRSDVFNRRKKKTFFGSSSISRPVRVQVSLERAPHAPYSLTKLNKLQACNFDRRVLAYEMVEKGREERRQVSSFARSLD